MWLLSLVVVIVVSALLSWSVLSSLSFLLCYIYYHHHHRHYNHTSLLLIPILPRSAIGGRSSGSLPRRAPGLAPLAVLRSLFVSHARVYAFWFYYSNFSWFIIEFTLWPRNLICDSFTYKTFLASSVSLMVIRIILDYNLLLPNFLSLFTISF